MKGIHLILILALALSSCKKDVLHWKIITRLDSHTTANLNRIQVLQDGTIVIAGGDKYSPAEILISHDDGYDWERIPIPGSTVGIYGLSAGAFQLWLGSCFGGQFVLSADQGISWRVKTADQYRYLIDAAMISESEALVATTVTTDSGSVWKMDTNGHMSIMQAFPFNVSRLRMLGETTGYLAAYGAFLKTTDGGATWNYLNIKNDNFVNMDIHGADSIWVCGYEGSVFFSANAGENWKRLRNGNEYFDPKYHLADILMMDADHGYCAGENGKLIYTDDGGKHWMEHDPFTSASLRSMARCANGDLIVCGEGGELWRLEE